MGTTKSLTFSFFFFGLAVVVSAEAAAAGMSAAILHWGLHAWGVYAVVGLALAFFCFNRGLPLTLRSAFYPLLGDRVWGPFGHIIDVTAVLATIFGLATSLGLGAEQIAGGLNYLFEIEPSGTTKIVLIAAIIAIALASVVAGLDKGVKRLSEFNMGLAALLLLFVLIAGPTVVVLQTMAGAFYDYARYLVPMSNWIGREDTDFYHGWQTFYWADRSQDCTASIRHYWQRQLSQINICITVDCSSSRSRSCR